ncbi:hypothetical protein BO70DRAFT_220391 [Aspergillus heteromorphus CBS 117.55]|uniref:Uncharacterized protein n=1 Tax=Aspergillus heteromorphus CBS 117.55 TaxID=1448321 RepID=A0A317WM17_9EURO|nr:uncharacterized protein BO70DRAFT_220391 [Aspergillus heteromorphus CBS 117.55]PWY86058.1 hypothetical protein BO70DRAFT_220391 [Aspergillus heteromorphus CBS 117.55]
MGPLPFGILKTTFSLPRLIPSTVISSDSKQEPQPARSFTSSVTHAHTAYLRPLRVYVCMYVCMCVCVCVCRCQYHRDRPPVDDPLPMDNGYHGIGKSYPTAPRLPFFPRRQRIRPRPRQRTTPKEPGSLPQASSSHSPGPSYTKKKKKQTLAPRVSHN